MVALLTKLTSLSLSSVWSAVAEEAFIELKRCFSLTPVLVQSDRARQFVVEVDASDIGAVLTGPIIKIWLIFTVLNV